MVRIEHAVISAQTRILLVEQFASGNTVFYGFTSQAAAHENEYDFSRTIGCWRAVPEIKRSKNGIVARCTMFGINLRFADSTVSRMSDSELRQLFRDLYNRVLVEEARERIKFLG